MDAVTLLLEMVSTPSPSGEERALADLLVERMAKMGFASYRDAAGNAVGVLGDGPRQLVLLGHMDTVGGGPEIRLADGKLYGRGSVDAKGPLATFIQAAARCGPVPGWQLVVVGAVEEEAPSSKGAYHAAACFAPDACLIGEPSGWDGLTLGYKGFLHLDYEWRQETAHTSGPDQSAAEHAVDYWDAVRDHVRAVNNGEEQIFQQLQATIRQIRTGREGNDDVARAKFSFRLPPGLAPETLTADLRRLDTAGARLRTSGQLPAYHTGLTNPLVASFLFAFRRAGVKPHFKYKTGTSDMNVVGPAWDCPIAAYGPGDARLDHTPHEHMVLEEYLRGIELLEGALARFFATASRTLPALEEEPAPRLARAAGS